MTTPLLLPADGPPIATPQAMLDLVGEAMGAGADTLVVPVERLAPAFFDLRSGLLGEIAQKAVNYQLRLVAVGDVAPYTAASQAFADYVREANRGQAIRFVPAWPA